MVRINFHDALIDMINGGFNYEMYIKDGDNNYHKISDITIYGYRKVNCVDGYDTYVKYLLEADNEPNSDEYESVWVDD